MKMLQLDLRKISMFSMTKHLAGNPGVQPASKIKRQPSILAGTCAVGKYQKNSVAPENVINRRVEIGTIGPGIILYGRTTNKLQK